MNKTPIHSHAGGVSAGFRCLRPHQWVKNLIVFVPALAGHKLGDMPVLVFDARVFVSFCLCASGTYVINDLADLSSDRQHPRKKMRPFASGELSPGFGWVLGPCLLFGGLMLATGLSGIFAGMLMLYLGLSSCYTLWARRIELLDVFFLAGLYTIRLAAGYTAGIAYSAWLLIFSMFVFLSLALLKRYTELAEQPRGTGGPIASGRGYRSGDLELVASLGTSCGYLATLVLGLYVNSQQVLLLYKQPMLLLFVCPLWLYWISHIWLIAHRGGMHDDPVVFAIRDRTSYIVGLLILLVLWMATLE